MVKLVLLPVKATRTFVRLAGVRGALLLAVALTRAVLDPAARPDRRRR